MPRRCPDDQSDAPNYKIPHCKYQPRAMSSVWRCRCAHTTSADPSSAENAMVSPTRLRCSPGLLSCEPLLISPTRAMSSDWRCRTPTVPHRSTRRRLRSNGVTNEEVEVMSRSCCPCRQRRNQPRCHVGVIGGVVRPQFHTGRSVPGDGVVNVRWCHPQGRKNAPVAVHVCHVDVLHRPPRWQCHTPTIRRFEFPPSFASK